MTFTSTLSLSVLASPLSARLLRNKIVELSAVASASREWPSLRSLCKAAVQWQRCWPLGPLCFKPTACKSPTEAHARSRLQSRASATSRTTCVTKVSRAVETLEPTSASVVFKLTTAVRSAVLEMSKRAVGFCVVALLLSKTYHNKHRAALSFFSGVALSVYSRGLGGRKASSSSGHPFQPDFNDSEQPCLCGGCGCSRELKLRLGLRASERPKQICETCRARQVTAFCRLSRVSSLQWQL